MNAARDLAKRLAELRSTEHGALADFLLALADVDRDVEPRPHLGSRGRDQPGGDDPVDRGVGRHQQVTSYKYDVDGRHILERVVDGTTGTELKNTQIVYAAVGTHAYWVMAAMAAVGVISAIYASRR